MYFLQEIYIKKCVKLFSYDFDKLALYRADFWLPLVGRMGLLLKNNYLFLREASNQLY